MRTDGPPERPDRPPDDRGTSVSRRAFLVASGLVAGPGVGSVVGAPESRRDGAVEVEATAPHLQAARDLGRAFERSEDAVTVRVTRAERSSPDGFRDGAADVQLAGRPVVAPERADPGASLVEGVGIRGWAALSHSNGEWRDVLQRPDVEAHWDGDTPVETWSETDWQAVPDDAVARSAPDTGASVFVRGTRSYQYSRGLGGVGYYQVDDESFGERVRRADATPVVRLEYVNVAPDARDSDGVEALLDFYRRRTPTASTAGARFVDPVAERAL